jgi:hypothetical protein
MALSIVFENIRSIQRAIGTDANGLSAQQLQNHQMTICDLNFICREILGFRLDCTCNAATEHPSDERLAVAE